MIQKILENILSDIYTQTEALKRLRILREYVINILFKPSSNPRPLNISNEDLAWLNSLDKRFFKAFDKDSAEDVLDKVEEEIKKIQPLIFFLPLEIPKTEVAMLGQKVRKDYGKNFLIDIKLDPNVIAGAALSWNGVYKDYSLRQKMADNREEILSKIKEYTKH